MAITPASMQVLVMHGVVSCSLFVIAKIVTPVSGGLLTLYTKSGPNCTAIEPVSSAAVLFGTFCSRMQW
eukprot:768544-Hanusia_phi.AAC.3